MGLPNSKIARVFYRSAKQRFADGLVLFEGGRTTGAVYLGGYGVECILKALILHQTPMAQQAETALRFRGAPAHDYQLLARLYRERGGPTFSQNVREWFVLVNTWSTQSRYFPGTIPFEDARDFLEATEAILDWADQRI